MNIRPLNCHWPNKIKLSWLIKIQLGGFWKFIKCVIDTIKRNETFCLLCLLPGSALTMKIACQSLILFNINSATTIFTNFCFHHQSVRSLLRWPKSCSHFYSWIEHDLDYTCLLIVHRIYASMPENGHYTKDLTVFSHGKTSPTCKQHITLPNIYLQKN